MPCPENSQLPPVHLPKWSKAPTCRDGQILCSVRKRFVKLEPEEWVRQHWLDFLVHHKGYPGGSISVEHRLVLNGMNRRADVLCHSPEGQPLLLLECKAPDVKLTQGALDQVWEYRLALNPPPLVLVLSNGLHHQAFATQSPNGGPQVLHELPSFTEVRRMTADLP